jgi:ATP-binding cassette subfamily B protein
MSLIAAAGLPTSHGRFDPAEPAALDWRIIRRILGRTQPYAGMRNTIFVLTVVRAVQKPALAWALAAVINGPITGGDFRGVLWGAAGFLVLAGFTELTFHFRQRLQLELGEAVVHDLRNAVFRQLQRMPMSYFNKTKLGRILGRVITDIEAVRRGVQQVFFFSLLLFGQMAGSAALMLYYNGVLFGVLLVVGPLVWLTNRHFHPRLSRHSRAVAESQSRLTGSLAESVKGMRVIQGFVRQREGDVRYDGLIRHHADNNVGLAHESSLYLPLLDLHSQIFLAAMLTVGGYGALHGLAGMEIGSLIAFFFLPSLFFQSLQHLGTLYTQAITALASAERVFQLLDLRPEWSDAPEATDLPDPRATVGATSAAARGARVEFRRVSFGYAPGRPVLHDLSFVAEPGQTVALVGHTGSGKTSIINLVAKFYLPDHGEILVDDREIRSLRADSLRGQMGLVLQTNFLFTGTVLENIRLGRPGATDEEIRAAAASLDCLDLLEALPRGLATEVGERGTSLSLGQRQLICFTRALLADPRLLILDEATSSVDTITESRLQHALDRLLAARTSFVVAHRLSTIRRADQILVLDGGRIVERGPHLDLLAQRGAYHALYRQFAQAEL